MNKQDETAEEQALRIEKYWDEVEEKTNSVLECLKGVSYRKVKSVIRSLQEKTEEKINSSIVF